MTHSVELISKNLKRLRELKKLSQKDVAINSGVPQGQYSRIENGKVEPSISTLDKLANVFDVPTMEFFKSNSIEDDLNLPLLEKIKLIDTLESDEQSALLKIIDIAISKKRMKDNLTNLLDS